MTKSAAATVHEVSVAEAKSKLSELLGRVEYGGDRIVITKRGRPVAELVAPRGAAARAPRALLEHDDPFFAIIDDIVAARETHVPRATPGRARSGRRR